MCKNILALLLSVIICATYADSKLPQNISGSLLKNGNFSIKMSNDNIYGWKKNIASPNIHIKESNGNSFLIIQTDIDMVKKKRGLSLSQSIKLKPYDKLLYIQARFNVPRTIPGEKSWQLPKLFILFYNKKGKHVGGYPCSFGFKLPTKGWITKKAQIKVPINAVSAQVRIEIWGAVAELQVDDIILSRSEIIGKNENSVLPEKYKLYWCNEPIENISPYRSNICINGLWKFIPEATEQIPKNGWGYIRVPGAWNSKIRTMPGIIQRGQGQAWMNFKAKKGKVNSAWYKRTFKIPEKWKNRKIIIDFDRICTDALIFINNKKIGELNWPGGEIDITNDVKTGKKNNLAVRVLAINDKSEITEFTGDAEGQVFKKKIDLNSRGIVGDVVLKSCPKHSYINDIFVKPSVRKKQLALDIEISDVLKKQPVKIEISCVDTANGKVEKKISYKRILSKDVIQKIELIVPWSSPKLWDFKQPNLYKLHCKISGEGFNDEYVQPFGFREFWISGKKFMLNGKEIRFRPRNCAINQGDRNVISSEHMNGNIDGMISIGGNIQEFWPWNHYQRGTTRMLDLWFDCADKKGWPVIAPIGSIRQFVEHWDKADKERTEWLTLMKKQVRKLRNHPSILFWIHSPNRLGTYHDQSPERIGNSFKLKPWENHSYMKKLINAQRANLAIKQIDPTRPVTMHSNAAAGDIQTINCYLSWHPLQEQEEWLSNYIQTGNIPVMCVEFGFFPPCDYRRGRNNWSGSVLTEWQITEYLAAYLGNAAYKEEGENILRWFRKNHISGEKYKRTRFVPNMLNDKIMYLMGRNIYLAWRTIGITGGMLQWELQHVWDRTGYEMVDVTGAFQPGRRGAYVRYLSKNSLYYLSEKAAKLRPGGKYIKEAFTPTVAWIAGERKTGDIAAFTAKDHNFSENQTVEKSIVIINDTRKKQDYHAKWDVTIDKRKIAGGTLKGRLKISETMFLPISFKCPVIDKSKAKGTINLEVKINGKLKKDQFKLTVFKLRENTKYKLLVFDPVGKTSKMLSKMGYKLQKWAGNNDIVPLVIGRESLDSGINFPGNLIEYVKQGGKVICFQQSKSFLENKVGFRVGENVIRRVFPVEKYYQKISESLTHLNYQDWSGKSTLKANKHERSTLGWHWGNRGAVCSVPIEKPHFGGWKSIFECGFDLAFSPLMELEYSKGTFLLCQFDLEDHWDKDPVAKLLTQRIIDYVINKNDSNLQKNTFYSGNKKWQKIFNMMGLEFTNSQNIKPECEVIIVGPGSKFSSDKIKSFAQKGGKVLMLPGTASKLFKIPVTLKKDYCGYTDFPEWPVLKGLSLSDFRVRAEIDQSIISPGKGVEIAANGLLGRFKIGKGVIIFCELDPSLYNTKQKPYLRFSRWRNYRVIAQILSNLGCGFAQHTAFLEFTPPSTPSISLNGNWKAKIIRRIPGVPEGATPQKDKGISKEALKSVMPSYNADKWGTIKLPGIFEKNSREWRDFNGEAVFRKKLMLSAKQTKLDYKIVLGRIDDFDSVYINGIKVGQTDSSQSMWWNFEREYSVPGKILKEGLNIIAIRVFDNYLYGGVLGVNGKLMFQAKSVDSSWYYPDYNNSYLLGDSPFRYYRW